MRDGNNGITAIVDAYGRVREQLDLDDIGVLDGSLPQKLPPTLYSRIGDWGLGGMMLILLALAALPPFSRVPRREPPR